MLMDFPFHKPFPSALEGRAYWFDFQCGHFTLDFVTEGYEEGFIDNIGIFVFNEKDEWSMRAGLLDRHVMENGELIHKPLENPLLIVDKVPVDVRMFIEDFHIMSREKDRNIYVDYHLYSSYKRGEKGMPETSIGKVYVQNVKRYPDE